MFPLNNLARFNANHTFPDPFLRDGNGACYQVMKGEVLAEYFSWI